MSIFSNIRGALFENPGQAYNAGNYLAVAGAVAQVITNVALNHADVSAGHITIEIGKFFMGDIPSGLTTAASFAYLYAGNQYHKGYRNNDPAKIRQGHIWSGVGATLLGTGLAILGRQGVALWSAIAGGALHAGGKVGSLVLAKYDDVNKMMPLISRLATITASAYTFYGNLHQYPDHPWLRSILPITLAVCSTLFWGKADTMLMPNNIVKRALVRAHFISANQLG